MEKRTESVADHALVGCLGLETYESPEVRELGTVEDLTWDSSFELEA